MSSDGDNHNGPEKTSPTSDDLNAIHQRRIERLEREQAYEDENLLRALVWGLAQNEQGEG